MNYEHDYYYDWIVKKNSKINVPIPPKIKADEEPIKPTQIMDMKPPLNNSIMNKARGNSVDAPIIRRDTYNSFNKLNAVSNSYNNTKYSGINPINGLKYQEYDPKSSRRDQPTNMMTTTGMMSSAATKDKKYDGMGTSGVNFNERNFRNTSSNAYSGSFGVPVLKKNYTSDHFNQPHKPYPLNRGSSQQITTGRGQGDFNSYFRSSAAAMFGSHAVAMPKFSTNQMRTKY